MHTSGTRYLPSSVLKLNVGFLMHGTVGMTREFPLELPRVSLGEELTVAGVRGSLRLSRTSEGLWVQGQLCISYVGECSRCLADIPRTADFQLEELFGLPCILPRSGPTEFAVHEDGMLDLLPLLRAEQLIAAETKALCREDCAGLCPECGQNRNEARCGCAAPIDPSWSSLAAQWQRHVPQGGNADE